MPDVADARSGSGEPRIVELESVPGFIVFDLPGAAVSAGGTRLAPDVTTGEVTLLARAMTYKFAALRDRIGGAKAGLVADPANGVERAELMARYCAEIRPMADAGQFLTGPDIGTSEEDFAPLRERRAAPAAVRAVVDGMPFEDVLTGFGVAVAAETALAAGPGDGLAGRDLAALLGIKPRNMLTQLAEWTRLGFLAKTGQGRYALPEPPGPVTASASP